MKPIPPGKIPTNTGGGLVGFGHPVGATGVKQILEVYRQMKGPSPPVLGSWGNTMRGAGTNKERWKGRRAPTQYPSTGVNLPRAPRPRWP